MAIKWLTAFIDVPVASFADTVDFWRKATNSTLSALRGDGEQFVTLIPEAGDSCLRVQRLNDGPARIHLDLHVVDPYNEARRAVEIGATMVADHGSHVVMASPSGMPFCFVEHQGEQAVAAPVDTATPHAVDQICIDVPATRFERECVFWLTLTGWSLQSSELNEYASLAQPETIPFRVLLQRLGASDAGTTARAHLDVSSGPNGDTISQRHSAAGATEIGSGVRWIVMSGPSGLPYCLTQRPPAGVQPTGDPPLVSSPGP